MMTPVERESVTHIPLCVSDTFSITDEGAMTETLEDIFKMLAINC